VLFTTWETVAVETPANLATSRIVGRLEFKVMGLLYQKESAGRAGLFPRICFYQRNFSANSTSRPVPIVLFFTPNGLDALLLKKFPFPTELAKFGWLNKLNASARNSRFVVSEVRNLLKIEKSTSL
jgi:hypothetical protein